MRAILLASVAVAVMPRAFMSETSETVFVTSKDWKDPVRINKSDYDADQDEKGEKRYTLAKSAEAPEYAGRRSDYSARSVRSRIYRCGCADDGER
jgi:PHD/YefM family antitoxin component YafN of YafNO toxin-antitoxin module